MTIAYCSISHGGMVGECVRGRQAGGGVSVFSSFELSLRTPYSTKTARGESEKKTPATWLLQGPLAVWVPAEMALHWSRMPAVAERRGGMHWSEVERYFLKLPLSMGWGGPLQTLSFALSGADTVFIPLPFFYVF